MSIRDDREKLETRKASIDADRKKAADLALEADQRRSSVVEAIKKHQMILSHLDFLEARLKNETGLAEANSAEAGKEAKRKSELRAAIKSEITGQERIEATTQRTHELQHKLSEAHRNVTAAKEAHKMAQEAVKAVNATEIIAQHALNEYTTATDKAKHTVEKEKRLSSEAQSAVDSGHDQEHAAVEAMGEAGCSVRDRRSGCSKPSWLAHCSNPKWIMFPISSWH